MTSGPINIKDDLIELAVSRYGDIFFLSTDNAVGAALRAYGEFAESDNRTIRQYLSPGAVALDVGAHVGYMTLAMADAVGPQGAVISFEPQAILYRCLIANALINGHHQVRVFNAAVGAETGAIAFPQIDYRKPENFGALGAKHAQPNAAKVSVVTIDQLSFPRLDLMKIDVEGMEPGVIEGAKTSIETHKPVIFFEANEQQNVPQITGMLDGLGYHHYWHASPFWRPDNFRGNIEDMFAVGQAGGTRADLNVLSLPPGRALESEMYPMTDPLEPKSEIFAGAVRFID